MDIPAVVREKAPDFDEKTLQEYVQRVISMLEGMKTGDRIQVNRITKAETRELFLETVKWYMRLHQETYQEGLSFADGYRELRKYDLTWGKKTPSPLRGTPPKGGDNCGLNINTSDGQNLKSA